MIGIIEIYLCALGLIALVGCAVRSVLYPHRRVLRPDVLPLGLATTVGILSVGAYVVTAADATLVLILASLLALGLRIVARSTTTGSEVAPEGQAEGQARAERVVLLAAAAIGAVALAPLFWVGFPTTIAVSIGDGWAYAAEVLWLQSHTLSDHIPVGAQYPLNSALPDQLHGGLTVGFELFATAVGSVTRRAPYELINATSATAFAVAVVSWRELVCALRPARQATVCLGIVVAAVSPLFVYLYAQNQAPNLLALALLPFAVAAAVRFARDPGWRALLVSGLAGGGAIGIYTPIAPWLIAGVLGAVITATVSADRTGRETGAWSVVRSGIWVGLLFASVLVAIGVVAPLAARQLVLVRSGSGTGVHANLVDAADRIGLMTGGLVRGNFGLDVAFGGGTWMTWVGCGIVIMATGCAIAVAVAGRGAIDVLAKASIFVGFAGATIILLLRFPHDGYAQWKTLIVSGALLAGVVAIMLSLAPRRFRWVARGGLVALAVVWVTTSGVLLSRVVTGNKHLGDLGFRRQDVQLGATLDRVSSGSTVLVEGVASTTAAFEMRMSTAYFGSHAHLAIEGLGTTTSYIATDPAPGDGTGTTLPAAGTAAWMPRTPWQWVLSTGGTAVASGRRVRWSNGTYVLSAAPPVDVTLFGPGWIAPTARPLGGPADLDGHGMLIVSNRSGQRRAIDLWLAAVDLGGPATLRLSSPGHAAAETVRVTTTRVIRFPVTVAARAVTIVRIDERLAARSRISLVRFNAIVVRSAPSPSS